MPSRRLLTLSSKGCCSSFLYSQLPHPTTLLSLALIIRQCLQKVWPHGRVTGLVSMFEQREQDISFLSILFCVSLTYAGREQKHSEGPSLRWSIVPSLAASIEESESSESLADNCYAAVRLPFEQFIVFILDAVVVIVIEWLLLSTPYWFLKLCLKFIASAESNFLSFRSRLCKSASTFLAQEWCLTWS